MGFFGAHIKAFIYPSMFQKPIKFEKYMKVRVVGAIKNIAAFNACLDIATVLLVLV